MVGSDGGSRRSAEADLDLFAEKPDALSAPANKTRGPQRWHYGLGAPVKLPLGFKIRLQLGSPARVTWISVHGAKPYRLQELV